MILTFLFLLFGIDPFSPEALYRQLKHDYVSSSIELNTRRFYLIGKGAQFFAFESEDKNSVLKLFKAHHYLPTISKRLHAFFSPSHQRRERWNNKFLETCACYELAFEKLKNETGLIALHFNKTEDQDLTVTLVDGIKEFTVDLNELPFVLQKKAILLPDYLKQLSSKEEQIRAIEAIKQLFAERTKKKITDARQSLRINYGFIDGKVVQIDPGKIYHDEQLDTRAEMERLNARVDQWVKKHFLSL